jgi:hypothetical protein
MVSSGLRMGEFSQDQIGLFDFNAEDFQASSRYFGLELAEAYFISHLRSPDLKQHYHATRPVYLTSSAGMLSGIGRGDGIYHDPRGERFLRGGFVDRSIEGQGNLSFQGRAGVWSGGVEKTFEARFGEHVQWQDSGELELKGRLLGPGTQVYVPWREGAFVGGTAHTGVFYEVSGTLFGEPVVGIVVLEQIFSPPGQVLHQSVLRKKYVGAWNGFANVFEDGSVQYGQFGYGAGPVKHGVIVDGSRQIVSHVNGVQTEYAPDGIGRRLEYRLDNGEVWESVVEPNGTMMDLLNSARAQGSQAQIHKGYVGQLGETRTRRAWYSILDWFPERLVSNAAANEIALPAGF